jgi:hypothetical protein
VIVWLGACAAPPAEEPAPEELVYVAPGPSRALAPGNEEEQTHPSLTRAADGSWLAAWDVGEGAAQRADARWLSAEGEPLGPVFTLLGVDGAGYTTPDAVVDEEGRLYVVLRALTSVLVAPLEGEELGEEMIVGGSPNLGFWTAPDLAWAGGELVVGWWDGELDLDAPADYRVARVDPDRGVLSEGVVGTSEGAGSPLSLAGSGETWLAAWSTLEADGAGAIRVGEGSGAALVGGAVRVDDGTLPEAPTRPALAVGDEGTVVVGWRSQDQAQQGQGALLRWLGPDLEPVGEAVPVGLDPSTANRVELAAGEGLLVAVWEEAVADGDVMVQLFDLATGEAHTGPVRVHEAIDGRQARPTVEIGADAAGLAAWVAFEAGDPPRIELTRVGIERR